MAKDDLKRRGKMKSPPQGVDAFSPAPDLVGSEMVDSFSPTPDSKSIAKASTPSVEAPSGSKGLPSGVQTGDPTKNFVTNQTKQSDAPAIKASGRDTRPEGVDKNFSVEP